MANLQINQLPTAGAITGQELVPVQQNGVTVQTTTAAISASPSQTQTFLTVGLQTTLPNSRYFSTGTGLGITDSGAQGAYTIAFNGTAASLEASGTGFVVKTAANTITPRSIAVSGAGVAIANGTGISGDPTISLSGLPLALANAAGTGLLALGSSTTLSPVTITGTGNQIGVTGGDGSSTPTISLAANFIAPGTAGITLPNGTTAQRGATTGQIRYNTTTARFEGYYTGSWQTFGLGDGTLTSVSGTPYETIVSTVGTIATVGLATNAVLPGTAAVQVPSGTTAQRPAGVAGNFRFNFDSNLFEGYDNSTWRQFTVSGGVITFSAGTTGFTPSTATSGAVTLAGTLNAANGGTGATSLTGYVYGNGISPMTASTTIPTTALSGTVTNAQLANSSVTYNGVNVALGASGTITAVNPNALTIGTGLSGTSYNGSAAVTVAIANTAVTAAAYGSASSVATFTVNAQGQLTLATTTPIAIAASQITSGTLAIAQGGTNSSATPTNGGVGYGTGTAYAFSAAGTSAQVLTSAGAASPTWTSQSGLSVGTATNIAGGAAGSLPYQSGAGATTFLTAGTNGFVLTLAAGVPTWAASTGGVTSFSAGTTGLTPSTGTTGAITLAGTLAIANGGTNSTATPTAGGIGYGTGTAHAYTAAGTAGQVLTSNGAGVPTWSTSVGSGVTTFQTSLSGLTPSTATSGAVTLAGTLGVANGGTGLTTLTANYIPYGNGTSALQSSANFQFNGTTATLNGQLTLTNASDYNLYASGAGGNYMAGKLGIGAVPSSAAFPTNLYLSANVTGGAQASNIRNIGTVQSDVVTTAQGIVSTLSTTAAAFTLVNLRQFNAGSATIGAGSTVTNQYGFYANALTGATNNFAFYANNTAATGSYNFYAAGTADNYFAGNVGIGTTTMSQVFNVTGSNGTGFAGQRIQNSNGNLGIAGIEFSSDTTYAKAAIGLFRQQLNGGGTLSIYNSSSSSAANWATTDARLQIDFTGFVSLGAPAGSESLRATPVASAVNYFDFYGAATGSDPYCYPSGSDANRGFKYLTKGTGSHQFQTNTSLSNTQFVVAHTASAVNWLQATGQSAGNGPSITAQGSDTNIAAYIISKGGNPVYLGTGGSVVQFAASHTASAVNYLNATGAATTASPTLSAQGSDANINLTLTPKGTGTTYSQNFAASNGLVMNNATINTSYTLPTGYNAMSAGPVTIASGIVVTVPSGSTWVVV